MLKKLELRGCSQLTEAPASLPGSLEALTLQNEKQTIQLPDVTMLLKLEELSLGIVSAADGSAACISLPNLKHLELEVAKGSAELPFPLKFFPNLRTLTILDAGSMKKLPGDIGSTLEHLRALIIFRAVELTELPESITELQTLTSLCVRAQKLACLPEHIGALSRLSKLDVSECSSLTSLPSSLTQLSCLFSLKASESGIRLLPPNISRLSRLKNLDLQDCKELEALPQDLTNLKSILIFNADGCDKVCDEEGNIELPGVGKTNVMAVGRVVCDAEAASARLNDSSVLLEGCIDPCQGVRVRLDLRHLPSFSLFPGQILAVEGSNPSGYCLVAKHGEGGVEKGTEGKLDGGSAEVKEKEEAGTEEMDSEGVRAVESGAAGVKAEGNEEEEDDDEIRIAEGDEEEDEEDSDEIRIIAAAGPFTTIDSWSFDPLKDLIRFALQRPPDVLLLTPPSPIPILTPPSPTPIWTPPSPIPIYTPPSRTATPSMLLRLIRWAPSSIESILMQEMAVWIRRMRLSFSSISGHRPMRRSFSSTSAHRCLGRDGEGQGEGEERKLSGGNEAVVCGPDIGGSIVAARPRIAVGLLWGAPPFTPPHLRSFSVTSCQISVFSPHTFPPPLNPRPPPSGGVLWGGRKYLQDAVAALSETHITLFQSILSPTNFPPAPPPQVEEYCERAGGSCKVLLLPSLRDAHHTMIFPQPPFDSSDFEDPRKQVLTLGNPSAFTLDNQVGIACSSTDILRHLSKEEIARVAPGDSATSDRMSRLAAHMIGQRSFYPLFPPPPATCLDLSCCPQALDLPFAPHLLFLPSDLVPFVKVLPKQTPPHGQAALQQETAVLAGEIQHH
ncbi:unnamed protein product [Closterium sp. NIES-65]|nr:unnamed protein product [Closterium sp. NIES-65]